MLLCGAAGALQGSLSPAGLGVAVTDTSTYMGSLLLHSLDPRPCRGQQLTLRPALPRPKSHRGTWLPQAPLRTLCCP